MDEMPHASVLAKKVNSIIRQLETESEFLDAVIESSLELQALLRVDRRSGATAERDEPQTDAATRIVRLKEKLGRQFQPIKVGRDAMLEQIGSVEAHSNARQPLTAKELARRVPDPQRSRLMQLRSEIRSKLNRIRAISMGNQAVLVYTMDFYNRLLTGLALRPSESGGYDASGSSTAGSKHRVPGNFIQTNC